MAKAEQQSRLQRNEEKWSPLLMEAGWTAIPSIILEKQHALGLDAMDVNILLHLARHWWYRDNPPHPSKASIAECLRVDPSTVRRHIAGMEAAGFIRREARYKPSGGQENNMYHFDGLIKEATPLAEEAVRERKQQQQERVARRRRKGSRSVVDNRSGARGNRE
ncbi:MAG: helix-turn-helix domain-containing protein [Chloroflexi bacterium]|nr:helix-turn-helix domain-containing protein [Chloroflexota bacterium]